MLLQIYHTVPPQVRTGSPFPQCVAPQQIDVADFGAFKAVPKSKKQKKKKVSAKNRSNGDSVRLNGIQVAAETERDNDANDEPEPDTPVTSANIDQKAQPEVESEGNQLHVNGNTLAPSTPPASDDEDGNPCTDGLSASANATAVPEAAGQSTEREDLADSTSQSRGTSVAEQGGSSTTMDALDAPPDGSDSRLDALAREKQSLRDEVAELRKSIDEIQGRHEEELSEVRCQLEETQNGKEQAESQYRTLLGKVNTIRTQLGERLKADAVRMNLIWDLFLLM